MRSFVSFQGEKKKFFMYHFLFPIFPTFFHVKIFLNNFFDVKIFFHVLSYFFYLLTFFFLSSVTHCFYRREIKSKKCFFISEKIIKNFMCQFFSCVNEKKNCFSCLKWSEKNNSPRIIFHFRKMYFSTVISFFFFFFFFFKIS